MSGAFPPLPRKGKGHQEAGRAHTPTREPSHFTRDSKAGGEMAIRDGKWQEAVTQAGHSPCAPAHRSPSRPNEALPAGCGLACNAKAPTWLFEEAQMPTPPGTVVMPAAPVTAGSATRLIVMLARFLPLSPMSNEQTSALLQPHPPRPPPPFRCRHHRPPRLPSAEA